MRGLRVGLRLGGFSLALLWLSSVAAADAAWKLLDLGQFTLRAPASMVLTRGGADSVAGILVGEDLRLDYDFGLYADPLQTREGVRDFIVRDGIVDGLAARFVTYSIGSETGETRSCVGVHVPEVTRSVLGPIRLTVLACSDDPRRMKLARAIFSTLRFRHLAHE